MKATYSHYKEAKANVLIETLQITESITY